MRKHHVSLTLDTQLLEIVDARGPNRSETIGKDLWDYYGTLDDLQQFAKEEDHVQP